MPLRVFIMPDKFKGTLTAEAAAVAMARGWRKARPGDRLTLLPINDGGDGFGEVAGRLAGVRLRKTRTVDAARRPILAAWWWDPKTRTAIIESARVIGLAMLPPGRFHPFQLDTLGLGTVIREAARLGARRCLIGLGGSATNDGGFGLALALGWKFFDANGNLIEQWTRLKGLKTIRAPRRRHWFKDFSVAVDVQNPLLGLRGATRVYGPQKGLRRKDFSLAEDCLRRMAVIVWRQFALNLAPAPGAGAAGGLGFGLLSFLGGRIEPGFDLFARQAALDRRLRSADLVITGEGGLDDSTLMGKGVGQVARRCQRLKIPCLALAGRASRSARLRRHFEQIHTLTSLASVSKATGAPAFWLERLAAHVASRWAVSPAD